MSATDVGDEFLLHVDTSLDMAPAPQSHDVLATLKEPEVFVELEVASAAQPPAPSPPITPSFPVFAPEPSLPGPALPVFAPEPSPPSEAASPPAPVAGLPARRRPNSLGTRLLVAVLFLVVAVAAGMAIWEKLGSARPAAPATKVLLPAAPEAAAREPAPPKAPAAPQDAAPPKGAAPEDAAPANDQPPAAPPVPQRAVKSLRDVLAAIRQHLGATPAADRKFQRYFTLAHLYNNPRVPDADLACYRDALQRLLAALAGDGGAPGADFLDAERTVCHVDVRRLGWDRRDGWRAVLKAYPYGLRHTTARDADLAELAQTVSELSGSDLPYVRGDWFVAAANLLADGAGPAEFPEPVAVAAGMYRRDLGPEEAASELDLRDPVRLREQIRQTDVLRRAGLGRLAEGAAIPRATWETVVGLTSPFQDVAGALDLGTPLQVRR